MPKEDCWIRLTILDDDPRQYSRGFRSEIRSTGHIRYQHINSVVHGRFGGNFKMIILKLILQICRMGNQCEIALRQMPYNLTNEKPILVQVMACCLTATSHYMSQCWHKYMSPFGVTMPQHFNRLRAELFWETINSFGYSIIYQNWDGTISLMRSQYWFR